MSKPRLLQLVFTIFLSNIALAQNEISLSSYWDYQPEKGAYEKINKMVATSNGLIIAVGEAIGSSFKDTDGFFAIIDPEEGTAQKRKKFGGKGDDGFNSVIQNHDGTLTVVGYTQAGPRAKKTGWVMQLDMNGKVLFELTPSAGATYEAELIDLAINSNGEILAIGIQYNKKSAKNWMLGLDNQLVTTNQIIENLELGKVESITEDTDNNFIILGNTNEKNRNHPNDAWLFKVDKDGIGLWNKVKYFGDKNFQQGLDITPTPLEGGYAIVGANDAQSKGMTDTWLLKIDKNGEKVWEKKYGKHAEDVGNAVIELSEGGFAILGHTKSHLPKAMHSTLQLIITDESGNFIDSDTYNIINGEGDEIGHSLVELFCGEKIVIAGSSVDRKSLLFPSAYVGTMIYKIRPIPSKAAGDDRYGNNQLSLNLSNSSFYDADNNNFLESGERGYFAIEISNKSGQNLHNVAGSISGNANVEAIKYWDNIKLGTIRSGQTKRVFIPIYAQEALLDDVELNLDIKADDTYAASSVLKLEARAKAEPAKLIVEAYNFIPAQNPPPGTITRLQVELVNVGALPSQATRVYFSLPPGVEPSGPSIADVPSIRPRGSFKTGFSFRHSSAYQSNDIPVTLQTGDQKLMKTFYVKVGSMANNVVPQKPNRNSSRVAAAGAEIYWVNPKPNVRTVDVNNREVNFTAMTLSNNQMAKRQIKIFINGQKYQGQKMDEAKLGPPEKSGSERIQQFYENSIRLKEGNNKVKIVCYDEDGRTIKGESKTLIFNYIPKDKPNLFVLSIGVEHEDLHFTVKDAKDFSNMYWKLKDDKGRGFKKVKVFPLLKKEETTSFNIKKAFIDLGKMGIKDNDLLVIFISSHGKINDKGDFLLIPSDYDSQYEDLSSIHFKNDVLKRLRNLDGNKLVFIDACHSGGAGSKTFSDRAASKVMRDLVHATSGMEIFASCGDSEFSYEDQSWGNGAFTKAIIEAFQNQKVDINGSNVQADIFADDPASGEKINGSDGVITLEELKLFVQKRVPYLVKMTKQKKQFPINKSTDLLPDNMGIYMVNEP